ncbi:hypothetical protein M404DRAFT_439167 [Pisolithus tinctorius Marx 270]|uniref:Uncharacterized protein n=1 Tax=Pisolithus tinctorius Marx 270 TaxID=870435 RepID=A0A0C3KAS1_PISTI|nr:hypothetical protein M404DRAFT_439167 [Pisolithus tinctorius Marx 270]
MRSQQPCKESVCTDESHPATTRYHHDLCLPFPDEWTTANVGAVLVRFKDFQGSFIDSLVRAWTMPNLVSGLIFLSVIVIRLTHFLVPQSGHERTRAPLHFYLWDVWVMSMVFFVVYILVLVWHSGSTADPSTLAPLSPNATIGLSFLGPSLLWRDRDRRDVARVQEGERMTGGTGMAKETRDAIREVRARDV